MFLFGPVLLVGAPETISEAYPAADLTLLIVPRGSGMGRTRIIASIIGHP